MKVSYNWLKEYIDLKLSPQELAHRLTMSGLEVKSVEKTGNDYILEAEVTSNRPDLLSIYGIAREIQAITGLKLKPIKTGLPKIVTLPAPLIKIEDKKGCPRYIGRVIESVEITPSPQWLTKKIESAGLRAVNNAVDITNFCLMEMGQPLHAFDYDKLEGGAIIVRRAKKGEEIVTIDAVKRVLDENVLVIADAKRPVAIAGVMGGRDTEVVASTTRVLLESAYFDPPTIRRTSKKFGISSESSYRFERGVDLECVSTASDRAASLICDLANAKAVSKASDVGIKQIKPPKIILKVEKANKILGTEIPSAKCLSILKGLGLRIKKKSKDIFEVLIPSFRRDLKEDIDLIEEIARIYGYEKVPETLTRISLWGEGTQKNYDKTIEETIRETLVGIGLNEVITYALTGKDPCIGSECCGADALIKLQNPLSAESEMLRSCILCSLLDVITYNINRKITDLSIFELGKSYFWKNEGAPSEKGVLAIALCGMKTKNWHSREAFSAFDLKGIVESLFERVGILKFEFESKPLSLLSPSSASCIKIGGKEAGILGRINNNLLSAYDIRTPVFGCELDLKLIYENATLERRFSGLPKYPSVIRDISLIVDDKIPNSEITDLIKRTCGNLAVGIRPFDLYRGEQVPKGSKSILYSVEYRVSDRTLTDEEVNNLDRKVREVLVERFSAKIR